VMMKKQEREDQEKEDPSDLPMVNNRFNAG
jgi:hypothetical protein